MEKWLNKIAVVTGSSSGIGRAILTELVKAGVNVVGLARHVEKFQKWIDELKNESGKIYARQCDVSDVESVNLTFKWIEENVGQVDILINCAGIFHFTTILNSEETANVNLKQTIDTNFMGAVYCSRKAYQSMMRHGNYGYIITINSVGGHYVPLPRPELTSLNSYAPSKHAITALTEVLRHELTWMNNEKIRVSSLSPGETRTEICDSSVEGTSEDYYANNPSLDADNVAAGIIFILSLPYKVVVSELTMRCVGARV